MLPELRALLYKVGLAYLFYLISFRIISGIVEINGTCHSCDCDGVFLVPKENTNVFTDRRIKTPKIYPVDHSGHFFI